MKLLLAVLLLPLVWGCSFSTIEDDRMFHDEMLRHVTADGDVTRTQGTEHFVVTHPEQGEAIIAIGERKVGEAAQLLVASRERGATTGIGSMQRTVDFFFGPEGVMALILGWLGLDKLFGKSRLVKEAKKLEDRQREDKIVASVIKAADGKTK